MRLSSDYCRADEVADNKLTTTTRPKSAAEVTLQHGEITMGKFNVASHYCLHVIVNHLLLPSSFMHEHNLFLQYVICANYSLRNFYTPKDSPDLRLNQNT